MNLLICDDRPADAAVLNAILCGEGFAPTVFHSGADVISCIKTGVPIDVCILDIVMPGLSGVELGEKLRQLGFSGHIVFLSSSKEYGPESYQVGAFDYLLKPVSREAVQAMLKKLEQTVKNADTKSVLLKTGGTMRSVLFRDISHVEAVQHNVVYHLTGGGEFAEYGTFSGAAEKLLRDSRFARCHRSFIVNMDEIAAITGSDIMMRTGRLIPISRACAKVKQRYFDRALMR